MLTVPNLPENRITLAATGNYPEIILALKALGIKVLSLESRSLPDEVSRHQDMLMCHTGGDKIFLSPELAPAPLISEGFRVLTGDRVARAYPEDVKLNLAVSRDFFIYNPKTADKALVNELLQLGKRGIEVKQGYTKCSVCFISENALITDDPSVYNAFYGTGIDVLEVSKGDIFLSAEHYGFIGGATGKIDKSTLAVTGSLKYHRDGGKIRDFCLSHGVNVLELFDGRIIDIGGILPLK